LDSLYTSYLPVFGGRDAILRQLVSLYVITILGAYFFNFAFATLSYVFIFDKTLLKHPKMLKGQIYMEMYTSHISVLFIAALTVPLFLLEVRGYSRLYRNIDDHSYGFAALSIVGFIIFTDSTIYWIHRLLHHPKLYSIHKMHHKWIVPTPFASHAFHPVDGYLQSLPYHLYVFLVPFNAVIYLVMYFLVNIWTISIHDGSYWITGDIINGAHHHTIHHSDFLFNYGQYTTFWDRVCGSYRSPIRKLMSE